MTKQSHQHHTHRTYHLHQHHKCTETRGVLLISCFQKATVISVAVDVNTRLTVDNTVRCSFTWLTVVPIQPCSTICSILGCGGSWLRANASSFVFFCMSSIATSIGVSTTCAINTTQSTSATAVSLSDSLCLQQCANNRYQTGRQ